MTMDPLHMNYLGHDWYFRKVTEEKRLAYEEFKKREEEEQAALRRAIESVRSPRRTE